MNDNISKIIKDISPHTKMNGVFSTQIPDLELIKSDCITQELHMLHKPAICLVLQGKKRVIVGQEIFEYEQCKYLAISFDLPITGQVIDASKEKPYLCLKLDIDISALSELVIELDEIKKSNVTHSAAINIGTATEDVIESFQRLISLLDKPKDIKILAPSIKREILYRILSSPGGEYLVAHSLKESKSKQIESAIYWIKKNFNKPFNAKSIAREAHLSVSTLYKYFKLITLMSPLQFQKKLRLQEAKRLMVFEKLNVATASERVGYESPSQFNREYKRAFGVSPKADCSDQVTSSNYKRLNI